MVKGVGTPEANGRKSESGAPAKVNAAGDW
jgi:hypothetical protein